MQLTDRQLNRTYLQRQFLLARDPRPVPEVFAQLVAVQAQDVDAPYIGLWTRTAGFTHAALTAALEDRSVVRGGLLRGTQHLAAGADYRWLRPLIQQRIGRVGLSGFAKQIAGLDLAALTAAGREILRGQVLTRPKLAKQLAERYPGRDAIALAWAVQHQLSLVHPPPSGIWRRRGHVTCALAEDWLGEPLDAAPDIDTLVLRYLRGCGPASVADLQQWSGLKKLRAEVDRLRPRLRTYRDARGQELFDLPDLPIADAGEVAPVRFLPAFDNLVLSHDDRARVMSAAERAVVCPGLSIVRPTVLVDGFVAGVWAQEKDALRIVQLRRWSDPDAVLAEAERLRLFLELDVPIVVEGQPARA